MGGLMGCGPPSPLLAVPNVTAHQSTYQLHIRPIRYGTVSIPMPIKGLAIYIGQTLSQIDKLFLL